MVPEMVFRFRISKTESERLATVVCFQLCLTLKKTEAVGRIFFFLSKRCAFHSLGKRQQSLTLQEVINNVCFTGERYTRRFRGVADFLSAVALFSTKFSEEYVPNVSEQTWAGIPNTIHYHWISTKKNIQWKLETKPMMQHCALLEGTQIRPLGRHCYTLNIHLSPF